MSYDEKIGIVLVSYGTLNSEAYRTYEKIRSEYIKAFPGSGVLIAFTSGFIRRALSEREVFVHDPSTALSELRDQGFKNAVAQSLHVIPGGEFQRIESLIQVHEQKIFREEPCFRNLGIGAPLLSSLEDCTKVSKALVREFQSVRTKVRGRLNGNAMDSEDVAYVLMGHGTSHSSDRVYSLMAEVLERDHKNVFLGTLEGHPGIDEVVLLTKKSGARKVMLMPFLLVAGSHAMDDLAGDKASSWRSVFGREGFSTDVILKGLGENGGVVRVFIEHTRKAVKMFKTNKKWANMTSIGEP